jgi:hypothetical protein
MARTIYDPNPQLSYLDDGQTKRQIADLAKRALELAHRQQEAPALSEEQIEAERFQYESNEYAAQNPLYASARSAQSFLVLPLERDKPLVDLSEATREPKKLLAWWQQWPEANVGVVLGRKGGIFALRVEDNAAYERLKGMAAIERHDADTDRRYVEYRDLIGGRVKLAAPSEPFSTRSVVGWGREFSQAVAKLQNESRNRNPQTFWLVWSYPAVQSGADAYDYRSRTIATGLRVAGEGEVLAWGGSILDDGVRVSSPASRPPECALWLASILGRARSRKVMRAAREAYDAALIAQESYWMGIVAAQKAAGERAMREALAEREKAEKAVSEAERA